jgi:hypothetical protein
MGDSFENKVRAAAVAGWWTLLIGVLSFIIQRIAYLLLTSARPFMAAIALGERDRLGHRPECLVLGSSSIKSVFMAYGIDSNMADSAGSPAAKK